MNTIRGFCLVGALMTFGPVKSEAGVITYDFTATVTTVADYSPGHTLIPASIHVGSTEVGSFSFDTSAPGSPFVHGTPLDLMATVTIDGAYTYTLNAPTTSDEIDVSLGGIYKRGPAATTSFGGPLGLLEFFSLHASSGDLSTVHFTAPPDATVGISDAGYPAAPYYYIGANITSLQQTPEPASLVTFGGVIACAAACRGWRRRKSAKAYPSLN